jgi:cell division protein FtsN
MVLGGAIVLLAAYAPELLQETVDRTLAKQRTEPKPTVEFKFDERLRTQEIHANPEAYTSAANSKLAEQMEYLIQAASFQHRTDADTLRAELLLSGLPAATHAVRVGDKPWYRVTVGPFPSNVESGRAMTKLRGLDLDAFLIKREIKPSTNTTP